MVASDGSQNVRTDVFEVVVADNGATLTYDDAGNPLTRAEGGVTWAYEWNAENQLTRVTADSDSGAVEVATFAYDPLGRRVEKVAGSVTTAWAYDGQDILQETITGGTGAGTFRYVHGPGIDEPLARRNMSTGAFTYLHADGLGSITKVTDQSAAVLLTRLYDAWGNLKTGASTPGYAFTGREWDPETGLYYYRARYYDSKIGRFASEDPIEFAGGNNFYAYLGADPVNFLDPQGLQAAPGQGYVIGEGWTNQPTLSAAQGSPEMIGQFLGLTAGMVAVAVAAPYASALWIEAQIAAGVGMTNVCVLGNKLDFVLGKSTGNAHNVARSQAMLRQMESIGLHDTPATRAYLTQLLNQAVRRPGALQPNGRILQETLLTGPNGVLKMESVWEGSKLITVQLYGR